MNRLLAAELSPGLPSTSRMRQHTTWVINLDRHEAASGLDWARDFLARYDSTLLGEVRINSGRGHTRGVYGRCWYPTPDVAYYRISCQVPGPFPHRIQTRRSPLYRELEGGWPPLPEGCVEGLLCKAKRGGMIREWKRVIGFTLIETLDEAIVWIMAHEGFHFLRRTGQIAGRNGEIEADRFADEQLQQLRHLRRRWSRHLGPGAMR